MLFTLRERIMKFDGLQLLHFTYFSYSLKKIIVLQHSTKHSLQKKRNEGSNSKIDHFDSQLSATFTRNNKSFDVFQILTIY